MKIPSERQQKMQYSFKPLKMADLHQPSEHRRCLCEVHQLAEARAICVYWLKKKSGRVNMQLFFLAGVPLVVQMCVLVLFQLWGGKEVEKMVIITGAPLCVLLAGEALSVSTLLT